MEEGTPKRSRPCELCSKGFQTTKSLKNHYLTRHGLNRNDPIVQSMPASPKKACTRCGKSVSNIWAHKNTCPKRKNDRDTTSAEPSPTKASTSTAAPVPATPLAPANPERLSDEGFMSRFRKWLESANGNYASEKTVRDYSRQILRFVGEQRKVKGAFMARHWMAYASRNFMPLANVCIYVCVCLFVLLDLFITVSQNCHRCLISGWRMDRSWNEIFPGRYGNSGYGRS